MFIKQKLKNDPALRAPINLIALNGNLSSVFFNKINIA